MIRTPRLYSFDGIPGRFVRGVAATGSDYTPARHGCPRRRPRATRPDRSCSRRRSAVLSRTSSGSSSTSPLRPLARAAPRDGERDRPRGCRRHRPPRARAEGRDRDAGGRGDVGSPNRILREDIGGKVIVRTGRRIPASSRRRRPLPHLGRPHGRRRRLRREGVARGRGRRRGRLPHGADRAADLPRRRGFAFRQAERTGARSSAARSTPSARSTREC